MRVGGGEGGEVSNAASQGKVCVHVTSEEVCVFCVFRVFRVFAPYPSGPLEHLSVDDPQFLLLQAVFQVPGPAGVKDEDGQQDRGRLEEEVERGVEVEEEEGEAGDQNGGDLARQHVEHVVSEFQDEGHR